MIEIGIQHHAPSSTARTVILVLLLTWVWSTFVFRKAQELLQLLLELTKEWNRTTAAQATYSHLASLINPTPGQS